MSPPAEVETGVAEALGGAGIVQLHRLGGGSIHPAFRVETSAGVFFLKWNEGEGARFGVEARALDALRGAADSRIRIPEVVGFADGGVDAHGWLLLEYLEPSDPGPDYATALGRGLAAIHRSTSPTFGWSEDNLIGPLPQPNPRLRNWSDFWREARLRPQIERARDRGTLRGPDAAMLDSVLEATATALEPVGHEPPSLLHGDLWGGNVHAGPDGRPVLVDPSSYHGHREVDLAMSELFGGFPTEFRQAYAEAWPLVDGYAEIRRPLYQLYYLLVHLELFGRSYLGGCRGAAERVLAATGG